MLQQSRKHIARSVANCRLSACLGHHERCAFLHKRAGQLADAAWAIQTVRKLLQTAAVECELGRGDGDGEEAIAANQRARIEYHQAQLSQYEAHLLYVSALFRDTGHA